MKAAKSPSLWRTAAFRAIWAGQTASIFGDRVTGIALPWLLLQQTRSPFEAALVSAALYLPLLLLAVPAGVIADRVSRRLLMIASDLVRAAALTAVVVVGFTRQAPPLWLLLIVVLTLGAGRLFFQVAYRAWLPDVTPDAALSRATAALEGSDAASTLAGPTLGGALIQVVGPVFALGADALSYVVSALTLVAIRPQPAYQPAYQPARQQERQAEHLPRDRTPRALAGEALAGARLMLASPQQRLLVGVSFALALSAGTIELLLATLAQVQLQLPAWQAGLIFGAAGVGGLAGSALAPRLHDHGWRRGLALACAVAATACCGLAVAGLLGPRVGFIGALVANLLLDGAVALGFILTGTQSALITPRAVRGRVNAAGQFYAALVRGLGLVAAGALSAQGSAAPAFLFLAVCFVGAGLLASARRRRGRS